MLGLSPCKHGSYSKDNLLESPLSWDEQQLQTHLDTMAGAITEQYGDRAPLLVGIESGGAWVARALNAMLAKPLPLGTLNPAFYRDDFDTRGLKRTVTPSKLPFEVDGQHILLVDDDEHHRVSIEDYLRFAGFEVKTAVSAEDAPRR